MAPAGLLPQHPEKIAKHHRLAQHEQHHAAKAQAAPERSGLPKEHQHLLQILPAEHIVQRQPHRQRQDQPVGDPLFCALHPAILPSPSNHIFTV